ncbi:MAG: prepilin peptidase [Opitutaceae bacterium]
MILSALVSLPFAALIFAAGAVAGRGLAAVMMRIAQAEGYPTSRYYAFAGGSWVAAVPILGHWLGPRGSRCPRLLTLELGGAFAFVLCWALFPPAKAACGALFLLTIFAASLIDLDHMILPDLFTVGLAVAGLILSGFLPELHGASAATLWTCLRSFASAGLGLAIGSAIVLWFSVIGEIVLGREVLGFGDVKFLGAIGAFCGWQGAVFAIFGGAAIGAIVLLSGAVSRVFFGGGGLELLQHSSGSARNGRLAWGAHFPFGPMLAAAAALYFLALHPWVDQYLAQYKALF